MPGFYYWFPIERDKLVNERAGRLNLDSLAGFDAAYIFEGRDVVPDQTVWMSTDGPGGNLGTLLYPKPIGETELPKCFYDPASQDWVRFKGYWIGREQGSLPKPADFAKYRPLAGFEVPDLHGNSWMAPVVRAKNANRCTLTLDYGFDENGKFSSKVKARDQAIWDLSGKAIDYLAGRLQMTDEEINLMAIEFLSAHYHLGVAEIYALGTWGYSFLDSTFVGTLLGCVTDWQVVLEHFDDQKKTSQPT